MPDPASVAEALAALPREHPVLLCAMAGAMGLALGSFANVAIYRLPRYCLSIVKPRSFCPACRAPIPWYDNVPVLSWLVLAGKCRACGVRIPLRYPLVELLGGAVLALLAWRTLVSPDPSTLGAAGDIGSQHWLLFAWWSLAATALLIASFIDAEMRIIPDSISMGGAATALLVAPLVPMLHGWGVPRVLVRDAMYFPRAWEPWLRAWLTTGLLMLIAAAALWLIGAVGARLARKQAEEAGGAMGLGDVKLIMLLAALLGWPKLLVAFFVAAAAASVIGLPKLIRKYRGVPGEDSIIPFGPFLSFGTVVAMLFSRTILEWLFGGILPPV